MIKCTERSGVYQAVKRLFDILASLAALAVLSPLFLVIAILILSEDGRPVFYKHTRVGKGGFAAAVCAQHGHELAPPDLHGDAVERVAGLLRVVAEL